MKITLANIEDQQKIAVLDRHIPSARLEECIERGRIYALNDGDAILGVLRYSLFWQTIPFLDLIYLREDVRNKGFGTEMMRIWETAMQNAGYSHIMTSTQADEDAWKFYEKLGYRKVGGFFPPEQEAEEWIYLKELKNFNETGVTQ